MEASYSSMNEESILTLEEIRQATASSNRNGGEPQLSDAAKKALTKQQYRVVGRHSAVKTCHWTKSMLRGRGGCYKFKFYGIRSHQCMQMTTSISCANRCSFCWRGYKAPVSKEWKWGVDDPYTVFAESLNAHKSLIIGFKGNKSSPKQVVEESDEVRHVALSLTGEPITYPKINELIRIFHDNRISTFLVTNGQYPEAIARLEPVTQLYVSVDAPNKELLKEVDNPLFEDFWERMLQSLEELSKKEGRTVIRLTAIKGLNMTDIEGYKELIELGNPDFIEVKGYMFVGASRYRLKKENMPSHEDVRKFAEELESALPDYEIVSDHEPSTVVLLAKKSYNKKTWIDFESFFREYEKRKAGN